MQDRIFCVSVQLLQSCFSVAGVLEVYVVYDAAIKGKLPWCFTSEECSTMCPSAWAAAAPATA